MPYILALILIFLAVLGTPLFAVILAVAMLGFFYLYWLSRCSVFITWTLTCR